jgi:hypothetical protein
MKVWKGFLLGCALLAGCDSDNINEPDAPPGIRFDQSGARTGAYAAAGEPADDPGAILRSQFAAAFPDSVGGLVIIGYQPTSQGKGDLFILQAPREAKSFECTFYSTPCHGRLLAGVTGSDHATVERWFAIVSGSLRLNQIGPERVRGTFDVTLESQDGQSTMSVKNGTFDVRYHSRPVTDGALACLLSLTGAGVGSCRM